MGSEGLHDKAPRELGHFIVNLFTEIIWVKVEWKKGCHIECKALWITLLMDGRRFLNFYDGFARIFSC